MTNITPTLKPLANVGEDMLWEAKVPVDTIASSADTIDISTCSAVQSGDELKIVSATSTTQGVSLTQYVTYTKATRKFAIDGGVAGTNVDSTISSDEIRIEFRTESN